MIHRIIFFTFLLIVSAQFAYSSAVIQAKKQQARQQQLRQLEIQKQIQQQQQAQQNRLPNDIPQITEPVVEDVVDLRSIWKELEFSSEVWKMMIDNEPKLITVENYIKLYAKKGIIIRNSPQHYVDMIDEMAFNNAGMLKNPFYEVMRFVAIIEYDFDNGGDRDAMARKVLGDKVYYSNRQRLGLE